MDPTDIKAAASATTGLPIAPVDTTLSLDPEFAAAIQEIYQSGMEKPAMKTAQDVRAFGDDLMSTIIRREPCLPAGQVIQTKHDITTFDGSIISVSRFATPEHRRQPGEGEALRSAVLHVFGGGMVGSNVEIFAPFFERNTKRWDVQTFAVDYRIAPGNPAPGQVEDVYAALKWLSGKAREFGVDPARLIIRGDSSGGGVAAGTALLARDRGLSPPLAKQVLVYPMLDDRTIGRYGPDWPVRKFLGWDENSNKIGWSAYVGDDKAGKDNADVSIYAAPGRARAEDLAGLPRTYIDTPGLDLFRDEDLRYAQTLSEAGVEVEFHLYPGVPHGFGIMGPATLGVVAGAHDNRSRAIKSV
ncbi:hypothetical protein Daus18300_011093 [Diaporthe australafricana]|uniref:Alpha/beta hydrolase fold-3 domain-containing protein n=1 Tax=Diaporthe australafricana TaxID=127596 RepID=A0ABR3W7X1_9PEZI